MRQSLGALAIIGVVGVSAAMLPGTAKAYPPVPAPYVEVVPAAPGPAYLWRPGYWHWNGYRYMWFRGAYIPRRPGYHHWAPPHWGPRGGWIPGHWN